MRSSSWRCLALNILVLGVMAGSPAFGADGSGEVRTSWAASVRHALALRMQHTMAEGRSALAASQHGLASWYGKRFHGRRTGSGAVFDDTALTAAHPTLPMGTKVLVRSEDTGRSVVVTVNDRGPFNSRIIDLSKAAAARIGMLSRGTAHVTLKALSAHDADAAEVAQAAEEDDSGQAVAASGVGVARGR